MAVNYRHDFHALSALGCPNLRAAAFGHHERRSDEAFLFIQRASVAKFVGNIRQHPP
jgi:hypothetical protein